MTRVGPQRKKKGQSHRVLTNAQHIMSKCDTCRHQPFINRQFTFKSQHQAKCKKSLSHLRELDVQWVSSNAAVRILVAGVADELRVPHPEVMFPIRSLRKYCNRRPETNTILTPGRRVNVAVYLGALWCKSQHPPPSLLPSQKRSSSENFFASLSLSS